MKFVYFGRTLVAGRDVAQAGTIRALEDRDYEALRASRGGDALLNVTPSPILMWFLMMTGKRPLETRPASSVSTAPCPACMEHDPNTHAWVVAKQYTHCARCNDSRAIAVPYALRESDHQRHRAHLREVTKGATHGRKN